MAENLKSAMQVIAEYTAKKKPATLPEALHMLAVINVIATKATEEK